MAKAALWNVTDAETRKSGEQTGLDTLVVPTVNGVHLVLRVLTPSVPELTRLVHRLGSTAARLKLKEIDGGPHKRRSMWLNSMQREEPYLGLTWYCTSCESRIPSRVYHRCCMAVVSSCREVLG